MATDWSARTAAIEHFEKLLKHLKRVNDEDKELYEAALNALRRSQDHTAIQNKLNEATKALRQFAECDINESNCASLEVATTRIRSIARKALGL